VTTLVELREVGVDAGRSPIIESATLLLRSGECVGISGANGSGKTTLLRVVATLRSPRSGTGTVLGARLGSAAIRAIRPRIGLLGHQPALTPELTLQDNLRFHAALRSLGPEAADEALEQVGLADASARRAADCSVGMLRRADLARLSLGEAQLLLLDEPTDGLDHTARPLVEAAIASCLERDGAALVVSHDEASIAGLATRVQRLAQGILQ